MYRRFGDRTVARAMARTVARAMARAVARAAMASESNAIKHFINIGLASCFSSPHNVVHSFLV